MNREKNTEALFQMDGVPPLSQALPLALQHVTAMIVGCVTPAIIISGAAGLDAKGRVILIQASLFISALSTLLQIFPLRRKDGIRIGAGLPVVLGVSFAYVPSMQAIAGRYGVASILGAQVIGGACAFAVGLAIHKIRKLFPPLIAGTVVFTIGLSLYPTAIHYMAGGTSSPDYGSLRNWGVALFTLAVVTALSHFAKGVLKLASVLVGMAAGYTLAVCLGMVDFQNVGAADIFQIPEPLYFGLDFNVSACAAISLLFIINSIQVLGDFSATAAGGLNREPTTDELQGAIVGYGFSNAVGAVFGCLPTVTYSQNVGIVATTKVVNRATLGISAFVILVAGLIPKFSALLTTIPFTVLGGATVTVFASIAMTGIRLAMTEEMNYRNTSIVGLAVALGMGVSQTSALLVSLPEWVTTIFGKSPVVVATLVAILLNVLLPESVSANGGKADRRTRGE